MRAFGRSMALSVAALAALALPLFVSSPAFAAGCSSGDQVADKYCAMGAATSVLGAPVSAEYSVGSGRGRDYQGGSILWSAPTGAHEVHGAIVGDYRTVGGPGSLLGFPLTDETGTPDGVGRFNHFAGGSVYWTPVTGAHEVHGAIRAEWVATGWERGSLGYPVTDEYGVAAGRESDFTGGFLHWEAASGTIKTGAGQVLAPGVAQQSRRDPAGPFAISVTTVCLLYTSPSPRDS